MIGAGGKPGRDGFSASCEERGVETFIAFVNSPPVWMTKNGHAQPDPNSGSTNLKAEYVDDFAVFLADVLEHFQNERGIHFDYISPINEPTLGLEPKLTGRQSLQ